MGVVSRGFFLMEKVNILGQMDPFMMVVGKKEK